MSKVTSEIHQRFSILFLTPSVFSSVTQSQVIVDVVGDSSVCSSGAPKAKNAKNEQQGDMEADSEMRTDEENKEQASSASSEFRLSFLSGQKIDNAPGVFVASERARAH